MDEFGGIPVSEDEFGGVLVDDESPSPSVIRDVPRGTFDPADLAPAIRKMGGEIVPGELGDTHADIIDREGIKAEDMDQRGFVSPAGFMDRESAAKSVFPKAIPGFEPGRLHSTDLVTPRMPPSGETSTIYGGPRKPVASLAETLVEPGEVMTTPRVTTPKFTVEKDDSIPTAVGKEVWNIATSIPEFMSSNLGVLALVSGSVAPSATSAVFTADMLSSLGNQVVWNYQNWDKMTAPQKAAAITDMVGTGAMAGLMAKATAKSIRGKAPKLEEAPPTERPGEAPLAAPTEGKAEVGEVVQAAPTEPAITTDKTVLPKTQVELRTPTDIAKELGIEAQESVGNFDRYLFKHKKNAEQLSVPKGSGPEIVKAQMEKALARWITPDEILKASDAEIKSIPQSAELSDRIASEMTEEQLKAAEPIIVDYLKKQIEDRKLLDEGKIDVQEYANRVMAPRTKGKLLVDVFAGLKRPMPEVPVEAKAPEIVKPAVASFGTSATKNKLGDPLGTSYRATPEDWATWQALQKRPITEEGVFAERERIKNKYGGMPPQEPKAAAPTEPTTVAAPTPEPIRAGQGAAVTTAPRPIPTIDEAVAQNLPFGARGAIGEFDSIQKILETGKQPNGAKATKKQLQELRDRLPQVIRNFKDKSKEATATPINLEMELGAGVSLKGVSDAVKASVEYLKSLRNEELKAPKMNDRRRAVLNWSAKLQRSYGEAFSKQRDIIKEVPKQIRREGITNWIQANGDRTVLQDRYNATTDKKLKAGYKAALELTPAEIDVANSVKADYANFASRGQAAGVLGDLKDNYVTQTWNLNKGPGGTGTGRTLKEKFRFSKARTFESFFEGEQLGYTPKTKDIAKLLPMYSHEMNSVIAAREMVAEMGNGVASDGRPLLAPRGVGIPVDSAEGGKATLVIPKSGKADTSDYKVLPNHPALSGWKWVAKDDAGNPVFLKADLAIHPEAFAYLKNVLGRSAIRDWYGTRTTALSELPKIIVKGIDMANSETKRTMLGMLATFHQIQTGTHAVGHRVNPFFSIPKIDLVNNRAQMDAAQHGLMMLPDRASMDQFMEGFRTSGLISKIPGIGPIADYYSHYLFHEYIPGLKYKTYEAILSRNQKVYAKDLAAGRVTQSDIKILSSEQANAAYGHLNYADLGRNPTVQHIAQVGLLAPDFLEARGRFAGQAIKGIGGAKVGREQLLALATLAIAQTAAAYVSAKLSGGDWDKKRPFEFVKENRRYTVRSVPEDLVNLVTKTRQFIHSRLSPMVGKGAVQYLTGVDYRGQKVKAWQTTKELAAQPLPLTIRGFTGLGNNTLSGMEQLAGSLGLRISRYSPSLDVYDMVKEFKKSSDDPKLQADIELQEKEVFSSVYDKLRIALRAGDLDAARKEYDAVKAIRTPKQIDEAMKPWTGGNLNRQTLQVSPRRPKPFTGSAKTEKLFLQGLNPEQRTMYDKAVKERLEFYTTFKQMLALPGSKEADEFGGILVE